MLARVYKMKDEFMLYFEAHGNTKSLNVNQIIKVLSDVGKSCGYFRSVKWLKLDFSGQKYELYQ